MPRGGPGPGGADIVSYPYSFTGSPTDRLISGFLTVNIRNRKSRDANLAYFLGWASNPNSIPENETTTGAVPEGTLPYYSDAGVWDTVNPTKPGYPTSDIFLHGEGGELPADGSRLYGRGSMGRTFEAVDPATSRPQVTLLTTGTSGSGADHITHLSYFTVPAAPGPVSGGGADGNGKTCVWFYDTVVGSGSKPVAVNNTGGYNYDIQINYDSGSDTMRDLADEIASRCNTYTDTAGNEIFAACAVDASNRVNIVDKFSARRSDSNTYTNINTMEVGGTNGTNDPTDPAAQYSFAITPVIKGSMVGFNIGETHTDLLTGDGLGYIASSKKKPYKNLGIGDYDCLVFFVSMAAHIDATDYTRNNYVDNYIGWADANKIDTFAFAYDPGAIPFTVNGEALYFHHNACQNFIKSSLISRHNNCSNGDAFRTTTTHHDTDAPTSFWTVGSQRTSYTFDSTLGSGERRLNVSGAEHLAKGTDYLQNNGVYRHGRWHDGDYQDGHPGDDYRFGIDLDYEQTDDTYIDDLLNCRGTNNFFSPLHSIDIGINHLLSNSTGNGNTSGGQHPIDYGLSVQIHLYGVNSDEASPQSGDSSNFFDSQINVMWQPFGETAQFKITDS